MRRLRAIAHLRLPGDAPAGKKLDIKLTCSGPLFWGLLLPYDLVEPDDTGKVIEVVIH